MKNSFLLLVVAVFVSMSVSAQFVGQGGVMGATGNFSQFLNKTLIKNTEPNSRSGIINSFNNLENTKGTRFLFNTWVKGDSVKDIRGNLIATTSFLFNYDKMTGNLLATEDKINNMSVAPTGINSFTLNDKGKDYVFQHVNAIEPYKFYLSLVKSDTGYSLYKQYAVKFIQANFRNDGLIQTGTTDDEYKDVSKYFIVEQSKGSSQMIEIKSKAIKALFEDRKEETDVFFKQHKDDAVDEDFLIKLVTYLNQQHQ